MAQNERECKEFKFKQLIKLQVDQWTGPVQSRVQRVAVAPRYGLTFVATKSGFKALKVVDIIRKDIASVNSASQVTKDFQYIADVNLQVCPDDLSVSSDGKLLSVCIKNNGFVFALVYSVQAFTQELPVKALLQVKLSLGDDELNQLMWNPGSDFPSVFASCISDGSLSLWQIKETSLTQQASRPGPTVNAKCLCWSPKGKQLVVGTKDGRLVQYDQNLVEKKVIPGPAALFNGQAFTAVDVVWESTYVFFVAYLRLGSEHEQPNLVHVIAQKGKDPVYIDLEDACFGGGEGRSPRYYSCLLPEWNMLVLGSATSLEAAVLGRSTSTEGQWERWILDDAGRAEIPLTEDYNEVYPMGFAVDFSSNIRIPTGDTESLAPCPVLIMLGTDGTLICYYMVHSAAPSIQKKPEVEVLINKTITGEAAKADSTAEQSTVSPTPVKQSGQPTSATQKTPATAIDPVATRSVAPGQNTPTLQGITTNQVRQPIFGAATSAVLTETSNTNQLQQQSTFGISTPTPQMSSTNQVKQLATHTQSPASTASQGKQLNFGTSAQSVASTASQGKQLNFGTSAQSVASTASQGKQPAFGTPTPQSMASTTSQGKQPAFGTPAQSVASTASQGKQPAFGLVSAVQAKQPAPGINSAALTKPPGSTFPFASPQGEQPRKPMAMGSSVLGGLRETPAQETPTQSTTQRTIVKQEAGQNPRSTVDKLPASLTASPSQDSPAAHKSHLPPKSIPKEGVVAREVSTKQPTVVSPTKRSASREEESESRGGAQGKPNSGQDHFMKALMEEMQHFQQELNEFKARGGIGLTESVGSKEEMKQMHKVTEMVATFSEQMKETTQSINNEIHSLKTECLEEFATLEECRAREERNQNPNYRHLLGARSLDPVSERKMRNIRTQAHYIEAGIQDIHGKLDLEWDEYQRRKKHARQLKCPTTDTIYRTLKNNKHVISGQQSALENMCASIGKPHLSKVRAGQLSSPLNSTQLTPDRAYQPRSLLGGHSTLRNGRVTPQRDMSGSGSPQHRATTVSPEKQSKLRDILATRVVTPVKSTAPGNLTMSRFWSADLKLDETSAPVKSPILSATNTKEKSDPQKKYLGVKPVESRKPQMRTTISPNKEKPPANLSNRTTARSTEHQPDSSSFSFSKTPAEFKGFGTKQSQSPKEGSSVSMAFNAPPKPAPNFTFSKTSTPVTKNSAASSAGFSFTAKPDTTFSFSKSSSQEEVAPVPKAGVSTTESTGFGASDFSFGKSATDKGQVKSTTSNQSAFMFGAMKTEAFSFNKPPDLTKTAEPKQAGPTFDKTSVDLTKTVEVTESFSFDMTPKAKRSVDAFGSFAVQATDSGHSSHSKEKITQNAEPGFSNLGSTFGNNPAESPAMKPATAAESRVQPTEAAMTNFGVGRKHLQFGSALAEALSDEPAPVSGQPATTGLFSQSKDASCSLYNVTPSSKSTSGLQSLHGKATATVEASLAAENRGKGHVPLNQGFVKTTTAEKPDSATNADLGKQQVSTEAQQQKQSTPDLTGSSLVKQPQSDPSPLAEALNSNSKEDDTSFQPAPGINLSQVSSNTPSAQVSAVHSTSETDQTSSDGGVKPKVAASVAVSVAGDPPQMPAVAGGLHDQGATPLTSSGGFHLTTTPVDSPQPSSTAGVSVIAGDMTQQPLPPTTGFSSAQNITAQSQPPSSETAFSFGTPTSSTAGGTSTTQSSTGFGFGAPQSGAQPTTQPASTASTAQTSIFSTSGFSFDPSQASAQTTSASTAAVSNTSSTPQTTSSSGFSFSTSQASAQTTAASTSGISFSTSQPSAQTTPASSLATPLTSGSQQTTASGGFGFGQQAPSSAGFGFGTAANSSQPMTSTTTTFGFGAASGQQPPTGVFCSVENGNNAPQETNMFGGPGLFGGLGGKPSAENANKNVFGGPFSGGSTGTANQGATLFGSQDSSGGFGGSSKGFSGPFQGSQASGMFSNTVGQGGVSSTGFGLGAQQTTPQKTTAFGGAPVFSSGGAGFGSPQSFGANTATFGGAAFGGPAFGSANTGGLFGASATQNTGNAQGFAGFANAAAPTFGNLAQQSGFSQETGDFASTQSNFQGFGGNTGNSGTQKLSSPSFSSYRS